MEKQMSKEKVSFKTPSILEGSKKIAEHLKEVRKLVEAMPDSGIKTKYLTSLKPFEVKVNSVARKEAIDNALKMIRNNPDILNELPDDVKVKFAMNKIESTIEPIIDADKVGSNVKKAKKNK